MGTSGLVAVLQPGELRPADEHSLWGVVNDLSDLAEAEPPANESALAKRKRLLASLGHRYKLVDKPEAPPRDAAPVNTSAAFSADGWPSTSAGASVHERARAHWSLKRAAMGNG